MGNIGKHAKMRKRTKNDQNTPKLIDLRFLRVRVDLVLKSTDRKRAVKNFAQRNAVQKWPKDNPSGGEKDFTLLGRLVESLMCNTKQYLL